MQVLKQDGELHVKQKIKPVLVCTTKEEFLLADETKFDVVFVENGNISFKKSGVM